MFKLTATILKDVKLLTRDKVGLAFMFFMPVVLAIVITAVQNSTFELVNNNKVSILLCNKDNGEAGAQLVKAIQKSGIFNIKLVTAEKTQKEISDRMHAKDALLAIIIPQDFSLKTGARSKRIATKALADLGMEADTSTLKNDQGAEPITLLYHPVLQESFRLSVQGALKSALQLVQDKQILKNIYSSINSDKQFPDTLENEITRSQVAIHEIPISRDGSTKIPNATQHNIPAWTVFAMFFVVISLGSNIVKEKLNGSFIRLKTLPTSYLVALMSKLITYLLVTLAQAALVFSIGIWLFPVIGLPQLNLPSDLLGLFIVALVCGWCAVSCAICIGVFAKTQEQANGIGAVSIVILAAIGGLLVPSFAMPGSFKVIMKLSPLHWCLEAFYGLFLEGGKLKDIIINILPLFGITVVIQLISLWGLKRKNLI